MSRSESFDAGASDWRPPEPKGASTDEPFDLSPEQSTYYDALEATDEHQAKMASMGVAERNQYMRGLREGLNPGVPKRGDFNNPLKKDIPKEAAAPRPAPAPKPGPTRSQKLMDLSRKLEKLARLANGKKR